MVLEYMPIRSFAVNIRSIRLMALNTLVSLSRKITFAMKAGILVHAKAVGTLGLDGLNGFQTAAERFGHVAAAQKRQTGNAADLGIGADAHLGQAIINEEQLHQQRCVAGQLDVNTHDLPQNGHLVILDHCAGKANDDGKNDACNAQPHGKYSGLLVERQILLDRIPVHCRIPPLYPDLRVKTKRPEAPSSSKLPGGQRQILLRVPTQNMQICSHGIPYCRAAGPGSVCGTTTHCATTHHSRFLPE